MFGKLLSKAFLRKPKHVCIAEQVTDKLERTMSLFDLLCIGVGGTVGSGVFVLTGLIANEYAGPGVVWSWIIAGICCIFSAMSYAELACRIPSSGSSYAYVYYALGELPAVIAAWCLTLEYGVSGAAVARSWGDKLILWVACCNESAREALQPGAGINIPGFLLQVAVMFVLLAGVDVGKMTVNTFTVLKMVLVMFIIVAGLSIFRTENVENWTPYGTSGVLRGATAAFFGYIGYDEVCCLAAEAKHPQKILPAAVFGTIAIVTVFYALASLALVGMMNYSEIDTESGFSVAFKDRGLQWAGTIVAAGELITLPIVVLISFLAQPRLQYAMAVDGLLPPMFRELDAKGNLTKSMIATGIVLSLIALLVPFAYLDDMISAGVLLSFNLTNTSLVVVRRQHPTDDSRCSRLCVAYNVACFTTALLFTYIDVSSPLVVLPVLAACAALYALKCIITDCPPTEDPEGEVQYRVPFVPFTPCIGIFLNYYLVAQLTWDGILMIFGYIGLGMAFYFTYGLKHSIGNANFWEDVVRESSLLPMDEETRAELERDLYGMVSTPTSSKANSKAYSTGERDSSHARLLKFAAESDAFVGRSSGSAKPSSRAASSASNSGVGIHKNPLLPGGESEM